MKRLLQSRFITATVFLYLATGALNIGNYIFHVLMPRMLHQPKQYGELESAIALMSLLSAPLLTVSIVVIKLVAEYKGKGDKHHESGLYFYVNRLILLYGGGFTILMLILSPFIQSFLHLSSLIIVILLVMSFLIGLYNTFMKSMLQGMSNFAGLATANMLEAIGKVILAVVLVWLGLAVGGAFAAVTMSFVIGYLIAYYFLLKEKLTPTVFTDQKRLFHVSIPVFITTIALTSLTNADILLVRYFFSGNESGYYAALAIMGRIIFFALTPVAGVMLPLVSEHHARGEKYRHFLFLSLLFTLLGGLIITGIYFWQPVLMIRLLPGSTYVKMAPLLGFFGIFILLYSLCYVMGNFFISISKRLPSFLMLAAAIIQGIGIALFHQNIGQVIGVSIVVSFLLLLTLLIYFGYISFLSTPSRNDETTY